MFNVLQGKSRYVDISRSRYMDRYYNFIKKCETNRVSVAIIYVEGFHVIAL